jgi:dolichol kinase
MTDPPFEALVARTEGLQPWRRIFHAGTGVSLAGALLFGDLPWTLLAGALGGIAVLALLGDLLRLAVPSWNRLFFRIFRPLASPREARGLASSTWFAWGCFLAVAVFPSRVAAASILVLALADPLASYAGRRWGRRAFGSGTVLGSLVFVGAAFLVLLPFAGTGVAAVVAGAVALVERIPWPLDDNLTVPLAVGLLLWSLLPVAV